MSREVSLPFLLIWWVPKVQVWVRVRMRVRVRVPMPVRRHPLQKLCGLLLN